MTHDHWIPTAEAALADPAKVTDVDVIRSTPPPVLEGAGARAITVPLFAAFVWAAALFQEQLSGQPLDPLALLLRFLAFSLTIRTLLAACMLWSRLQLRRKAHRFALAITKEGVLLRSPKGDVAVPREDVLAIRERDALQQRSDRFAPVYLVTAPGSGRTHVSLPPVLDRSPRALAERLMRWLGPMPARPEYVPPAPSALPSKIYDNAARGVAGPDVLALRHGATWLRRAPYATVLLGVAIAEGFARMDGASRDAMGLVAPGLMFFSLLLVPLTWMLMVRFDMAPRKGLSLVMTPAEAIMRTRSGVHVVTFRKLKRAVVRTKRSWSLLRGPHEVRSLVFEREGADDISYAESFLGEPAEVIADLCDAYQKGRLAQRGPSLEAGEPAAPQS